jgi:two-component system nitrate/nitrite sensor histidine kinase NarX
MRMPLLHESIAAQDTASALRYCDDVRQAVSAAHTNLRQLLSEFRVPMDPQGLKHALQSSILVFAQRTQVALDFDDQAPALRLSPTQESQVFHIVQESLANIAKHASARHAWLRLAQAFGRVDVLIEDDGTGPPAVDALPTGSHFGVDIMRERATRLGGRLDIGPRAGGGTRVHLSFPLAVDPTTAL